MKFITLVTLIFFTQTLAFAESYSINVEDRIKTQEFYKKVYPLLFDEEEAAWAPTFRKKFKELPKRNQKKILSFVKETETFIPKKILMPLVYWRFIMKNHQNTEDVLTFHMFYKLLILRDYIDNPLTPEAEKRRALGFLRKILNKPNLTTYSIYEDGFNFIRSLAQNIVTSLGADDFASIIKQTRFMTLDLRESFPKMSPYVLSYLGLVTGNKSEVISHNTTDVERIDWFNDRVIFAGGKLDWDAPYMKMPTREDPEGHISFQGDEIFMRIRDMIASAKDSIFIDIFLFGGTFGGTLARYLVDQTLEKRKKNPNFKTLLLHDYCTNYNMKPEMMPIFEYMKSRIENEPEVRKSFFLLQANIQRHPPGVPFRITDLIPKTPEIFKEIEKRNTYYESKIDHSKVLVVDAKSDHPKAYFGSKNWSDHSGGYYYDDVVYVEGPSAALVQASYYDDVEAALTLDPKEQSWLFFKEDGFGNERYLSERDEILSWLRVDRKEYPAIGKDTVRIAEANVDGKIKNVRNIYVDMIMNAKSHIYMEELFIYDKYINDALMKKKLQNPEIDIKIMADHNGNFGMNGLPNTLFIKELKSYGIEVKARNTLGIHVKFPEDEEERSYHQENHRKIASVDGKVLIGGSSNLNPDTLQGSFREFGAQLYNKEVIAKFEKRFLEAWNDDAMTSDIDIDNLRLKIGKADLSVELSALINNIGSQIFRSKDVLEKRHK